MQKMLRVQILMRPANEFGLCNIYSKNLYQPRSESNISELEGVAITRTYLGKNTFI